MASLSVFYLFFSFPIINQRAGVYPAILNVFRRHDVFMQIDHAFSRDVSSDISDEGR
jgi:hypothetical protein